MKSTLAGVFLSSLVLFAGGCSDSRGDDPADAVATVAEKIERKVHDRIAVETLRLDADGSLPVAELGPDGSLVIDGRPLPMTESQRAAAMAYRTDLENCQVDLDPPTLGA